MRHSLRPPYAIEPVLSPLGLFRDTTDRQSRWTPPIVECLALLGDRQPLGDFNASFQGFRPVMTKATPLPCDCHFSSLGARTGGGLRCVLNNHCGQRKRFGRKHHPTNDGPVFRDDRKVSPGYKQWCSASPDFALECREVTPGGSA